MAQLKNCQLPDDLRYHIEFDTAVRRGGVFPRGEASRTPAYRNYSSLK